ncbi:MAG: hypothetical protein ABIK07_10000 [Planctomycetota bacterium]
MKKQASKKSAATPKKQPAAKKKSTSAGSGGTKKKTVQKKATQKKTLAKTSTKKATVSPKFPYKAPQEQGSPVEGPLAGVSTVFASGKTNQWQPYPLLRIIEGDEILREKSAREEELEAQYEKAEVAYDLLSQELKRQKSQRENKKRKSRRKQELDFGDVTGMDICFRTKYGQVVSPLQYVITVNVSRKKSDDELKEREIDPLPVAINQTPIKVLEGSFKQAASIPEGRLAIGNGAASSPEPDKPVFGGQPVAEAGQPGNFGTLGFVFETKNGSNFGLTNKHVTSNNTIRLTTTGTQDIGKVVKAVEAHSSDNVFVDASYFSLNLPGNVSAIPYVIKDVNEDRSVDVFIANRFVKNTEAGFPVYKFGARTGVLKQGALTSIKAQVDIEGSTREGVFKAENSSNTFLQPGDSGSLALIKAKINAKLSWLVVGIVFAQLKDNDRVAYACHIAEVLNLLGLSGKIPTDRLVTSWENVN